MPIKHSIDSMLEGMGREAHDGRWHMLEVTAFFLPAHVLLPSRGCLLVIIRGS